MALTLNGTTGLSGIVGSAGTPALQGGDTNTGYYFGTDILGLSTGGNTRLYIDSNGRVFINRTAQHASSSERLSVNGMTSIQYDSTSAAGLYIFNEETTADGTTQPFIYLHDGSGIRAGLGVQRSTGITALNGQFGLSLRTGASGVAGTERLKIDSNGNLTAVNTAAGGQSVTLSVGASNASGVNDGIIKIINGGTGNGVIQWDYETNLNRAQIYVYRSTQELIFTVAGNERARITDDGIKLPADKGINFSAYATSGSNPSSNLLDDYEEGYHTPTIVGATSGSWTSSTYTTLTYTKIGRVVHIGGYLNISSESSPSGAMRISLPVAVGTFTHDSGNNSLSVSLRGHNGSTALYNVTAAVSEGTSYMELVAVAGTGGHTWIGDGQIDGSANIRIGGHYFTD